MKKIQVISRIKEIRKGKDSQRTKVIFEEGEPVYITDKDRLYVGDNTTYGGINSSTKNHTVEENIIPEHGVLFDLLYNKKNKCISIIDKNNTLTNLTDYECKINNLFTLVNKLSSRINDLNDPVKKKYIVTDLDTLIYEDDILTDDSDTISTDQ